jgi:hypothetical protein
VEGASEGFVIEKVDLDMRSANVALAGTETSNQGNFIEVLNLVVSAADIVKDIFFWRGVGRTGLCFGEREIAVRVERGLVEVKQISIDLLISMG